MTSAGMGAADVRCDKCGNTARVCASFNVGSACHLRPGSGGVYGARCGGIYRTRQELDGIAHRAFLAAEAARAAEEAARARLAEAEATVAATEGDTA